MLIEKIEAFESKLVNFILNILGVNSIRLSGLLITFVIL